MFSSVSIIMNAMLCALFSNECEWQNEISFWMEMETVVGSTSSMCEWDERLRSISFWHWNESWEESERKFEVERGGIVIGKEVGDCGEFYSSTLRVDPYNRTGASVGLHSRNPKIAFISFAFSIVPHPQNPHPSPPPTHPSVIIIQRLNLLFKMQTIN